jgi:hypothetical protein
MNTASCTGFAMANGTLAHNSAHVKKVSPIRLQVHSKVRLKYMSNLYGYTDYHGPEEWHKKQRKREFRGEGEQQLADAKDENGEQPTRCDQEEQDEEEEETNPLQVGFWMEGDSLAPPCGSSVSTIHRILEFAGLCADDFLYDFGCGDGRVCLEANAKYQCRTVGVEVEDDLVQRFQQLIDDNIVNMTEKNRPRVVQQDLRVVLQHLVDQVQQEPSQKGPQHASSSSVALGNSLDLPLPSVIVLYLLPEAIAAIQDSLIILLSALPNLRVLCNTWGMPHLDAADSRQIREKSGAITPLYLYTCQSLPSAKQE